MAFLIFERIYGNGGAVVLRPTGESFRLAGYNLIYKAWEERGQPIDQGWHVSAAELIQIDSKDLQTYDTRRMVIDFHPNARRRIGLIELLDVYAYTWGDDDAGQVFWTPLMLRMRDVYYEEYESEITAQRKSEIMQQLPEPGDDTPDFVEFLYLQHNWNWGKNGMTNAAFLRGEARAYFREFF